LLNRPIIQAEKLSREHSMKKVIVSLVLGLGMLANANAAGDAEAGKAKAAMCAACHGPTGESAVDMYPNLAGQHGDYIAKQLKAFKDGTRVDPVMAPMAAGLSDQDMADLGAFFESQKLGGTADTGSAESGDVAAAPVATVAAIVGDASAGKHLYENGDESRAIGACIGCHGDQGNSNVLIYPNLAKQHPEYIEKQLKSFKAGERVNAAMNNFSAPLTEQEIADLGAYFKDPNVKAATKTVAMTTPGVGSKAKGPVAVMGDVEAGKAKSATCVACHGSDGNALVPMYPKIAGQHEGYIVKQLMEFKSGVRADPVMSGMVAALSEEDMKNLAAYYASQTTTKGAKPASVNQEGKQLYFGGDASRGITACVACHSPAGNGMASAGFPTLANQNADYVKTQLEKFRSGGRANDMNQMMQNIAVKLSDSDIANLVEFISSID
jgi:cytochrome c553